MKVSLSWLRRYIEVDLGAEEISEALTMSGNEVAVIERIGPGPSDVILHLDLTPNRADCLSHIGVAREVSALTERPLTLPTLNLTEATPAAQTYTRIDIEDPEGCPRYVGRIIRDVAVGPSPGWLQEALISIGLRPINNVVDVTNFVLMEWGQPLHAFDHDSLEEGRIVVRRARQGETIVTIDGEERVLEPSMLVIADANRPVAVAGVMGGQATEVSEATRTVLLESAYFDPVTIRRCAKRLKLPTESSHRFERGVDPDVVMSASKRAAALIAEVSGGTVAEGVIDNYPSPIKRPTVVIRVSRTNAVLGTHIAPEVIAGYCRRLGLELLEPEDDEQLAFQIPPHRGDLERDVDLIEEVARLHGFEKIGATLPTSRSIGEVQPRTLSWARRVRESLVGCGLSEVINYSFIAAEDLTRCRLGENHPLGRAIPLMNPLSAELALMRTTLVPSLLRGCALNLSRRVEAYRVFELSQVFFPGDGETGADEKGRVAAILMGTPEENLWTEAIEMADYFEAKGIVENLCEALRVPIEEWRPADHPVFHPLRASAPVSGGVALGVAGEIHPEVLKAFDLPEAVVAFELDSEALVAAQEPKVEFRPLPRFPAILRDLAVTVDEDASVAEVEWMVREAGRPWLEACTLFDVYAGEPIPKGKKSLAFSLTYRASDRTLTDEETSQVHDTIILRLEKDLGATLRT
jgi:phenylalanyl-tRNA synthetase beta chain